MLKLYSLVFIGGGLGSVLRLGMARLLSHTAVGAFPFSTLIVNILGSLIIGLCWGLPFISDRNTLVHFLIIGFCGGFTTFSAFSWENLNLLKQGDVFLFFAYALLSIALCLLATWAGYSVSKAF